MGFDISQTKEIDMKSQTLKSFAKLIHGDDFSLKQYAEGSIDWHTLYEDLENLIEDKSDQEERLQQISGLAG